MSTTSFSLAELLAIVEKHWGYRSLRPLQERAMMAMLQGRDSMVVLPTGGGKSLCYQAPAVLRGGTTVVVSPLISLMKDQVDGLQACGVSAIQIDSSLSASERYAYETDLMQGAVNLLFVSPERLAMDEFCRLLQQIEVKAFAIDEAHCISHWGHDFRPEYRQLGRLKEFFPKASIHAFTATATARVREDVCAQLGLRQPEVLVGNFDRPNLNYRVWPRQDHFRQVCEVLQRHKNEPGIIYCMRRKDVDELAARLQQAGYSCLPYHAGRDDRSAVQEAFIEEKCDIIVATVAFGMGIDRSNVRFVLHIAMPKSVEHYQQETGRAGRDGLEAECVLLYSGSDPVMWRKIMELSAADNPGDDQYRAAAHKHLAEMERYCRGTICRHRALVEYFGQVYETAQCGACDVCLGDSEAVTGSDLIAQKILSCVARVKENFGINHVISVLRGENTEKVRSRQHDQLTTFGLLKEHSKEILRDWIYQLVGQGVLLQAGDEYPVLKLNEASWDVMRKQREVRLRQPTRRAPEAPVSKTRAEVASWEGVDEGLFQELRTLRLELARVKGLPPYIVFSDRTLRELARIRPASAATFHLVPGVGESKLAEYGPAFLPAIHDYCTAHSLAQDVGLNVRSRGPVGVPALAGNAPAKAGTPTTAGDPMPAADALVVAQKILSCLARIKESCHAGHLIRVLRGRDTEAIRAHGHDQLTTYGLLAEHGREQVKAWIVQLIEQGLVEGKGEFNPLLAFNDASRLVLKGQQPVLLRALPRAETNPLQWEGVDQDLFEVLAQLRDDLAEEHDVKPTVIFYDSVLRELARSRPSSLAKMRALPGVGEQRLQTFGDRFFQELERFCQERNLARDQAGLPARAPASLRKTKLDPSEQAEAFALFDARKALEEVQLVSGFSRDKVIDYLCDYVQEKRGALDPWVPAELASRIAAAAEKVGTDRLKPIYLELGEKVSYDYIRLVVATLRPG